ncbi:MAG: 4Fe-4S binding protein, partial [Tidjanibacter sp.]|nr:4Fe-4S binding protein [Tidjanibacter sp.]
MIIIDKKSDCSGCEACATACPVGCITFADDGEGFRYPLVDTERCIGCGACNEVCPVESRRPTIAPRATYGVVNPNRSIQRLSSSGGFFYILAEGVIERSGGVVFGAAFNERGEVEHRAAQSSEELAALRGSKYSQSHIGSVYAEALKVLAEGREVLFSGTPCQVSGFLHLVPQQHRDRVLAVDVVCHGVPSPAVWRARLSEITGGGKPQKINFRDKR